MAPLFCSFFSQVMVAPVEESMSPFALMQRGGWLTVILFACGILATALFLERFSYYRRSRLNLGEFLPGILALLRRQSFAEAIERCEEGHGPVVQVVRAAIYKRHLPASELRETVREVAQLEVPHLEHNLIFLSTVGYIAPLLGLLGTVTGMIEAFVHLNRTSGASSVSELSQGIYTALITTATGLVVAVPCYLAHNFLVAKAHSIVADMERAGIETIHTLLDLPQKNVVLTELGNPSIPGVAEASRK